MQNNRKICAIVVTYNTGPKYIENFNSIKDQVDKVIIIDNGSDKRTLDAIKKIKSTNKKKVEVIYNSCNFGLSKAQNIGLIKALKEGFDWIMLLDDDSRAATQSMINEMFLAYNKNPLKDKIGIIAPYLEEIKISKNYKVVTPFLKIFFRRITVRNKVYVNNILFIAASGSLIKTEVIKNIGLMNERFFIDCIDIDYCLRAIIRGYKIMVAGNALLYHQMGNSSEHKIMGLRIVSSNGGNFRTYTGSYAQILCWRKYGLRFPSLVSHNILCSLVQILKIVLFEKNKISIIKEMLKGWKDGLFSKL